MLRLSPNTAFKQVIGCIFKPKTPNVVCQGFSSYGFKDAVKMIRGQVGLGSDIDKPGGLIEVVFEVPDNRDKSLR